MKRGVRDLAIFMDNPPVGAPPASTARRAAYLSFTLLFLALFTFLEVRDFGAALSADPFHPGFTLLFSQNAIVVVCLFLRLANWLIKRRGILRLVIILPPLLGAEHVLSSICLNKHESLVDMFLPLFGGLVTWWIGHLQLKSGMLDRQARELVAAQEASG